VTEPLISIRLRDPRREYAPGDTLAAVYQVDMPEAAKLAAVEASVLWHTFGKGDEDMSVHYFERKSAAEVVDGELRQQWGFETALPNSPLSYDGRILKICWCVRVRVFLDRGKETAADLAFQLGHVPRAHPTGIVSAIDGPHPTGANPGERHV
jgi:hypothetical protein